MLSNQFWLVYLPCLFARYIVIALHQEQDDGGAGGGVGGKKEEKKNQVQCIHEVVKRRAYDCHE